MSHIDFKQFEGHTQGPWKVYEKSNVNGRCHTRGIESEDHKLKHCGVGVEMFRKSDAALMAAAPDLLTWCRKLEEQRKIAKEECKACGGDLSACVHYLREQVNELEAEVKILLLRVACVGIPNDDLQDEAGDYDHDQKNLIEPSL